MRKLHRFWRSFLGAALAAGLTLTSVPAQASWAYRLWDVYSQMNGEDTDSREYGWDDDQENTRKNGQDNNRQEDGDRAGQGSWDGRGDPASLLDVIVDEDGEYTSKWEVAAYIHDYDGLPDNFITKKEAQKLGWNSKEGNLNEVAPGKSIGGDHFGNYEGTLPEKKGRDYYECDIDYHGGYRSSKRIIYSDDGLIFYTEDHYETFDQLWPED